VARKSMQDLDRACSALSGTLRDRGLMAEGAVFIASRRNGYVCVDCFTNDGRMIESLLVGHTLGSAVEAVWVAARALELGRRTVSGRV
jgi:hypothetical protein